LKTLSRDCTWSRRVQGLTPFWNFAGSPVLSLAGPICLLALGVRSLVRANVTSRVMLGIGCAETRSGLVDSTPAESLARRLLP
jgi:hypothetical protein